MQKTEISWTERTWNPVTGCDKISQGCKNCYAESIANRFWKDRKFTDVICHEDRLKHIGSIKKPSMIFVNSMSDLFHEKVPFSFIDSVYEIMGYSTQHIFQILTKRPARALEYYRWTNIFKAWSDWNHIWLGVSVEDQKNADERIPLLLQTPTKVRWISAEPLLGPIHIPNYLEDKELGLLDWVVVGCESGPKRRECKLEWVEDIVNQCKASNIPVFVKQLQINNKVVKDIEMFPENLRIREYPV